MSIKHYSSSSTNILYFTILIPIVGAEKERHTIIVGPW